MGSAPKHASKMKKTQTMILAKITSRRGRPGNPRLNPRRRSEIPGPFKKLFWVTNVITIIK